MFIGSGVQIQIFDFWGIDWMKTDFIFSWCEGGGIEIKSVKHVHIITIKLLILDRILRGMVENGSNHNIGNFLRGMHGENKNM